MRLIDADELRNDIDNYEFAEYCDYSNMIDMIDDASTIEAEPVKRGRWIHHAGMNSKCSCCGRYFPVAEFEQRPFDVNFCIHCGARMGGVKVHDQQGAFE